MHPPQAKSPPRDDRDQSMGNSVVVVIRTISEDVQQVGGLSVLPPQVATTGTRLTPKACTEICAWIEGRLV